MTMQPPASRNTLKWHLFEEKEPDNWILHLMPPHYSELFKEQESDLMTKSSTGWRDNKDQTTRYAFFRNLSDIERQRIQRFIDEFRQFVIIGLNRNIDGLFTDELNSCLALDYIAESPEALHRNRRTPVGRLWHSCKYEDNLKAIPEIVEQMIRGLRRLPGLDFDQEYLFSYVPPRHSKHFDLPRDLAGKMVERLANHERLRVAETIVRPTLVIDKPAFKNLSCNQKNDVWQKIYSERGVVLSAPVKNRSVIVIDDLYQSGVTLWSYARFLKSLGATAVHGLVCVKSLRDTDNK